MSFILLLLWLLFGFALPESLWSISLTVIAIMMFFEGCYWTQYSGILGGIIVIISLGIGLVSLVGTGGAAEEAAKAVVEAPAKNDWSTGTMVLIGVGAAVVVLVIGGIFSKK